MMIEKILDRTSANLRKMFIPCEFIAKPGQLVIGPFSTDLQLEIIHIVSDVHMSYDICD
jgi:hypothetical protein